MNDLINRVKQSTEYFDIYQEYRGRVTKRSQAPLINHIDEGLEIMAFYGRDVPHLEQAMEAFCLHPLFQKDKDLLQNYSNSFCYHPTVVLFTLEYRARANAFLSDKVSKYHSSGYYFTGEPNPGPLPQVKLMLVADKVQNYKDFLIYHKGNHPRSGELEAYFRRWLRALNIDEYKFLELCRLIK